MSVKGTDPAFGRKGDVGLKVSIIGSGFAPGATASWALNGSPSASGYSPLLMRDYARLAGNMHMLGHA